ncbi:hypothetical protein [Paenibacillus ferrarius]|uniref:hypothetical protein n=1 Tax=Paenibacillus ferrarius TaxID=1469647 RepID=UPI003D26CFC0
MGLDEFIRPGFLQIAAAAIAAAATKLQKSRHFSPPHLLIEKCLQKGRLSRQIETVVRVLLKKTAFSQVFR